MRSISQLAYLQALDIPALVSRRNLPGAAPTRRLQLAHRVSQPDLGQPAPRQSADLAALTAGLQAPPVEKAPRAADTAEAATPMAGAPSAGAPSAGAPSAGAPVFSIAATLAGGWFWLDEIPAGREPGDDYGQLLLAICRALGWSQEPASMERFSYPVAAGLAGGVEEARQALLGFLTGRLSRLSPQGVVLMGEMDQPWFDRECLGELPVVQTVSAWQMLRDAALKPRAWADLKALRGDG